jgi:hypothetical protein
MVDHAVLIVGYGTTIASEGQEDFWLIKNQWGIGWGDKGYMKLKRNSGLPSGQCGILKQANYPTSASCTVGDCSPYQSSQFCRVRSTNDEAVECLDASDISYEEEWFIPNSTYVWVQTPGQNLIPDEAQDALVVLAILLSLGVVILGFMIGQGEYQKHKHKKQTKLENQQQEPSGSSATAIQVSLPPAAGPLADSPTNNGAVKKTMFGASSMSEMMQKSKDEVSAKLRAIKSSASVKFSAAKDGTASKLRSGQSSAAIKLKTTESAVSTFFDSPRSKDESHLEDKDTERTHVETNALKVEERGAKNGEDGEELEEHDERKQGLLPNVSNESTECADIRPNSLAQASNHQEYDKEGEEDAMESTEDEDGHRKEYYRHAQGTQIEPNAPKRHDVQSHSALETAPKTRRKSFASLNSRFEDRTNALDEDELDRRLMLARRDFDMRRNAAKNARKSKKKSLRRSKRAFP